MVADLSTQWLRHCIDLDRRPGNECVTSLVPFGAESYSSLVAQAEAVPVTAVAAAIVHLGQH